MANNYSKKTREILKDAGVISNKDATNETVAEMIKKTQAERQLKLLTVKNKKFLDNWLKTGNAIESYKKAYKIHNDWRASARSAQIIAKYKDIILTAMREKMGINEQLYFSSLMRLVSAKKVVFTRFGGKHVIPDNTTRVKALEMLGGLLRLQGKGSGGAGNTNIGIGSVNIYKDENKGIWSVSDVVDAEVIR